MESRPQNPEFRNNPENFHPCVSADESHETPKRPYTTSDKSCNSEGNKMCHFAADLVGVLRVYANTKQNLNIWRIIMETLAL